MQRLTRRVLILLTACLASAALASGQGLEGDPKETESQPAVDLSDPILKLAGEEIPLYMVVNHFFLRAHSALKADHPQVSKHFLKELGIPADSPVVPYFRELSQEAHEIIAAPKVDWTLEGEAFMQYQLNEIHKKAQRMAILYRNLLAGLEDAEISPEPMQNYLAQMRSTMEVSATSVEDLRYFEAITVFEEELSKQ
jgi:hypothetical protein